MVSHRFVTEHEVKFRLDHNFNEHRFSQLVESIRITSPDTMTQHAITLICNRIEAANYAYVSKRVVYVCSKRYAFETIFWLIDVKEQHVEHLSTVQFNI